MRRPESSLPLAVAFLVLCAALDSACLPPTTPLGPAASPTASPLVSTEATPTTVALAPVPSDIELARRFDADRAMADIRTLAGTLFAGRRAGTPGADQAADWIAAQFESIGLQPAGDAGTYLQTLSIPFLDLAQMPELTILDGKGAAAASFRARQDFREVVSGFAGAGRAEGEVVYVGAGTPRDYQDIDAAAKIVLTVSPQPMQAVEVAAGRRAAAVLVATADPSRLKMRGSYIAPIRENAIPCLLVGERVTDALLSGLGMSTEDLRSQTPKALGVRARASVDLQQGENRQSANVMAILPGSDAALADKPIILGAHYDHLGTDPDGTLYPGANDDASGVAVLLEIARTLTAGGGQPAHPILFAAWTAEEAGLLGSGHYVRHPRFPLGNTVAMLQLDVVGQGLGKTLNVTRGRGTLAATVHAAAAAVGVPSAVEPEEGGSDHMPFVQSGVPAVLLIWSDVMPLIHIPGDTPEALDAAKVRSSGQVALLATLRLDRSY